MTNIPVQVQLPQRRRNITHKLGRLYALGYDEVDRFTRLLNKNLGLTKKYSYSKLLEIITTSPDYIKVAELIVDTFELEHDIMAGDNLLEESLKHENKLAWVIDYSEDQLRDWINDKIKVVTKLCGNNQALAIERIEVIMKEDCLLRNIENTNFLISKLNIDNLINSPYKKLLINALIKCTVGYTIRCTGILA